MPIIKYFIGCYLIILITGDLCAQETTPAGTFHLVDFADLDNRWYLRFNESWIIPSGKQGIQKLVISYTPVNDSITSLSEDSLNSLFTGHLQMVYNLKDPVSDKVKKSNLRLGTFSYEFVFSDPHFPDSDPGLYAVPDSLTGEAGRLQMGLVSLINNLSGQGKSFNLEKQMLSVLFEERWTLNRTTLLIEKETLAITPVIWQRRKTDSGEFINDADTGLPVYYKNQLQPVELRIP